MKFIYPILLTILLGSCSDAQRNTNSLVSNSGLTVFKDEVISKKVLFVTSNAKYYGNSTIETTNNFPEIVYAYHEFVATNIEVDFVSPDGGQVPIGYIHSSDSILQQYLFDDTLSQKLKATFSPNEIDANDYAAIYYVGGGSAMFEVPENKRIQRIALSILEKKDGILSAICHGTAGITTIKNSDGSYAISKHKITGFPDAFEDTKAAYYKEFPFAIDSAVISANAQFEYSYKGWDEFMLIDGKIITGQDPSSVSSVAKQIIKRIK